MRVGVWALVLAFGIVLTAATPGQSQPAMVSNNLRLFTARITVGSIAKNQKAQCLSIVYTVWGPWAFIVTAKHCIEPLASSRLRGEKAFDALGVSIHITYPGGEEGTSQWIAWDNTADLAMVMASFDSPPPSFQSLCPSCLVYHELGTRNRIAVLSVLSAGGGDPVVSSGFIASDDLGRYTIVLPAAPGTSGAPIVDLHGNLVGIVVSAYVMETTEASWRVEIVSGNRIDAMVGYVAYTRNVAAITDSCREKSKTITEPQGYGWQPEPSKAISQFD